MQGAGVFSFGEGFGEWLVVPVLASVVPAVGGSSICISNDPLEAWLLLVWHYGTNVCVPSNIPMLKS